MCKPSTALFLSRWTFFDLTIEANKCTTDHTGDFSRVTACLFLTQKILCMPAPYRKFPFIFNYSTLILLVLAFVIARCRRDERPVVQSATEMVCGVGLGVQGGKVSYVPEVPKVDPDRVEVVGV